MQLSKKEICRYSFFEYEKKYAEILKQNNFISDYGFVEDDKQGVLRIHLKYTNGYRQYRELKD